jgi:hypothetical protein
MSRRGRRNADQVLAMSLACGATIEAAAKSTGLSEATVYRRLKDPDFQKQLQDIRVDMVQRTAGMLSASAMEAVKTLLSLQQMAVPAAVRLGAARAILEIGIKIREAANLEQRLANLEQQMAAANAGSRTD